MKRTYQENKSLYESIMRDVAKIVKNRLNESIESDKLQNELQNDLSTTGGSPFDKERIATTAAMVIWQLLDKLDRQKYDKEFKRMFYLLDRIPVYGKEKEFVEKLNQ